MTQEEKAKAYDEAIERGKQIQTTPYTAHWDIMKEVAEHLLPELKESEDEKTKRVLHSIANKMSQHLCDIFTEEEFQCFDAWSNVWLEKQGNLMKALQISNARIGELIEKNYYLKEQLEKQGEQKPDDNRLIPQKGEYYVCIKDYYSADSKTTNAKGKIYKSSCDGYINDDRGFGLSWINSCTENYFRLIKEEDWIVCEQNNVIGKPLQYKEFMGELIQNNIKSLEDKGFVPNLKLWNISDAKDGDVLINWNNTIFIFKNIEDESVKFHIAYNEKWDVIKTPSTKSSHMGLPEPQFEFHPATKEQRDTLMKAMTDAGYEFDFEKKELKNIIDEKQIKKNLQDNSFRRMFEQKLANNIKPIFNVGDKIQYTKGCGTIMTIEKIENGEYIFANNMGHTTIESGNKWYLVEQNPAWSEEDELMLNDIITCNERHGYLTAENITWLKSLKERYTWKPSDEQIIELRRVISGCSYDIEPLAEMAEQLKKLREE